MRRLTQQREAPRTAVREVGWSGKTPTLTPVLYSRHLAKRIQVGSPGYCMITQMPVLREKGE